MNNQDASFKGPGPDSIYHQALENGEFRIQQCNGCENHIFYPRSVCNHCGAADLKWITASGRGIVYSTSVVRQRPRKGPDYNVALVDLEEGPRMMTRVIDIDPAMVRIGMPVQGGVEELNGQPAVVFKPVNGDND